MLALQNHVRSLTRDQPPDGSRGHLSGPGGGLPGENAAIISQNNMLMEENQSLRIENEQLRGRLNELQGLNHQLSANAQQGMGSRFGGPGPSGHLSGSNITPINEDVPPRSLSFNLPSLTIGVKAENGGHSQYAEGTPSHLGHHHVHNYAPPYGNSGENRYYSSNVDQSPPLLPLTAGSHMLPNSQPAPGPYQRYDAPPNHNAPGPPSFAPPEPAAYSRHTGSLALGPGSTPYTGPPTGAYSAGFLPDNSEETVVGGPARGDAEAKGRDSGAARIQR